MSQRANIYIISGPSGSGKTTLCNRLLGLKSVRNKLVKSVSVTTRPRRANEKQKREYIFVTKEEFLRQKRRGGFLENKSVFGNLYGTPKSFVRAKLNRGISVLLSIDVKGALAVKRLYPKAIGVFILPPSLKILQKRLINRLTEGKKELRERLKLAKKEMGHIKHYDYALINNDLKKATRQLEAIFITEQYRRRYGLSANRRAITSI